MSSHDLVKNSPQSHELYELAEEMHDTQDGFCAYDYAKSVWFGRPERGQRVAGHHPWPTRERAGEQYVYSVPVMAGFAIATNQLLFVGKDDWKRSDDPRAWLVAESDILTGSERDREVIAVSVEGQRLWMQLAPDDHASNRHDYLTGYLDEQYMMTHAELWRGRYSQAAFEDIEALESMIRMVHQIRDAHKDERTHREALQRGMGQRSTASVGVYIAT